jgi:putative Mg2+ transporter-C (MgtC) family protein
MNILWEALQQELYAEIPSVEQAVRVTFRLLVAMLLGLVIGWNREEQGKSAGLRTHMLVALGAALFVLAPLEGGASSGDTTRVVQGVATGIGFLGGGVILQLVQERKVKGLTTAASIWMTAALGVAAGMGRAGAALIGLFFAWIILTALMKLEDRINGKTTSDKAKTESLGEVAEE